MDKVRVGRIINTFGIKGELKVDSTTDFPDERFKEGNTLFLDTGSGEKEVEVVRHRFHKGYDLLTFKGLENINFVEQYKGCSLYAYKDESLLDDNTYYISDYIGCQVYDCGQYIGEIIDVYDHTYQEILVIDHQGQRVLVPCVDAFVKNKDVDHKRVDLELIEGFIDED